MIGTEYIPKVGQLHYHCASLLGACLVEKSIVWGRNNLIFQNIESFTWPWEWQFAQWWFCEWCMSETLPRRNTGERSSRTVRHGKKQTLLIQIACHNWPCFYVTSHKFSQLLKSTLILFLQLTCLYIFLKIMNRKTKIHLLFDYSKLYWNKNLN